MNVSIASLALIPELRQKVLNPQEKIVIKQLCSAAWLEFDKGFLANHLTEEVVHSHDTPVLAADAQFIKTLKTKYLTQLIMFAQDNNYECFLRVCAQYLAQEIITLPLADLCLKYGSFQFFEVLNYIMTVSRHPWVGYIVGKSYTQMFVPVKSIPVVSLILFIVICSVNARYVFV